MQHIISLLLSAKLSIFSKAPHTPLTKTNRQKLCPVVEVLEQRAAGGAARDTECSTVQWCIVEGFLEEVIPQIRPKWMMKAG